MLWRIEKPGERGFTLLETVITVVIVAVVVGVAVPRFRNQVVHYRFFGYSRELSTMLHAAQLNALRTGFQHRVRIDVTTGELRLQRGDAAAGSTTWMDKRTHPAPVDGSPVDRVITQGEVCTDAGLASPIGIEFNPNHTATGRVVCLQSATGETKEVSIRAATGRVRVME